MLPSCDVLEESFAEEAEKAVLAYLHESSYLDNKQCAAYLPDKDDISSCHNYSRQRCHPWKDNMLVAQKAWPFFYTCEVAKWKLKERW
ncbi:hypothetical protein AVEN_38284-1 [Araneus ventricosus]|uniref:Uncharacterized protein n=1 Tax=Araneus ventricosus TaxID=182803 RepID=A0A4Y2E6X7_ARAVE|nr:hypothetical protein AVEN_38284-1 [Araneus ventricosus]